MEEHIKGIAVNMFNVFTNLNIVSMGFRLKTSSCVMQREVEKLFRFLSTKLVERVVNVGLA